MNTYEKKRKAALIAVAYYIEQEKARLAESGNDSQLCKWSRTGIEINMNKRQVVQLRGRVLLRA
jgi:hypothetical protein